MSHMKKRFSVARKGETVLSGILNKFLGWKSKKDKFLFFAFLFFKLCVIYNFFWNKTSKNTTFRKNPCFYFTSLTRWFNMRLQINKKIILLCRNKKLWAPLKSLLACRTSLTIFKLSKTFTSQLFKTTRLVLR